MSDQRPQLAKRTVQGILVAAVGLALMFISGTAADVLSDPNLAATLSSLGQKLVAGGGLLAFYGIQRRIPNANLALAGMALVFSLGCATSATFQTGLSDETFLKAGVSTQSVSLDAGVGALHNGVRAGVSAGLGEDLSLTGDVRGGATLDPAKLFCTAATRTTPKPGGVAQGFCLWRGVRETLRQDREDAK